MIVILTEKPSAGRNFARALGGMRGEFEGAKYQIVSSHGHLFALLPPDMQVTDELVEKYKKWDLGMLPWKFNELKWQKKKIKGSSETVENIRKEMAYADEVVIATDVDPSGEGELLAWEILSHIGWQGKTTRMYFTDEAEKSIQKAFRERKTIPSMLEDGDYVKALTRERWDYLSMQFSRAATVIAKDKGFKGVVRQGRLKSVMVYTVGKQLEDIKNYKRTPYYEVRFKDENGNVFLIKDNEDRFLNRQEVPLSKYAASKVIVDSKTRKSKVPGKLLDLAALSSRLAEQGHKAERVLATYQKMYEDQVVSYPRTEDKTITPEQFNELLPLVDKIADVVGVDQTLLPIREPRKSHVKTGGAHGANRPGINVPESLEALKKYGPEAPEIYLIIARNYLAMFGEDYEYTQEKGHLADYPDFVATANIPVKAGYKAIFEADPEEENEGENSHTQLGKNAEPYIHEGAPAKPQKPTMKWLVKKLEKYNVGTGATRTSTLADITKAGDDKALMKENKGALTLTDCGTVSYMLLGGCKIADAQITEDLFLAMKNVGEFKENPQKVLEGLDDLLLHDMVKMKENADKLESLKLSTSAGPVGRCPVCGKPVMEYPKSYSCSGFSEGCKFTIWKTVAGKNISRSIAEELLSSGKTKLIKGFKSKAGKSFSAHLKIKEELNGVEFEFEQRS